MLSVTVSQLPDEAELQSKSTVLELPVNVQVPVYVEPAMTAAIVFVLPV